MSVGKSIVGVKDDKEKAIVTCDHATDNSHHPLSLPVESGHCTCFVVEATCLVHGMEVEKVNSTVVPSKVVGSKVGTGVARVLLENMVLSGAGSTCESPARIDVGGS